MAPFRDTEAPDHRVAALAARQHGVVDRLDLRGCGLSANQIRSRVERGVLHRRYRGVYAVGHPTLTPEGRRLAAARALGRDAALSHRSAAAVWGLRRSSRLEVVLPTSAGRVAPPGITLHRHATLRTTDVTTVGVLPVTTVPRTLLDLAAVLSPQHVEAAIRQADDAELFDLTAAHEALAAHPRHRGARALRALLADLRDRDVHLTFSTLELLMLELCAAHRLPHPQSNVVVCGHRVDFHWPGTPVIVETDSWRWHGGRARFEADRLRDQDLVLAGYVVLRITHRQLRDRAAEVARRFAALLAR